jgi:hypothetical protein
MVALIVQPSTVTLRVVKPGPKFTGKAAADAVSVTASAAVSAKTRTNITGTSS